MGWLGDLWDGIVDFVGKLVNGLINAIMFVSDEIKIMRLRVQAGFATGLANGWTGIGLIMFRMLAALWLTAVSINLNQWWNAEQTQFNVRIFLDKISLSTFALRFEQLRLFSEVAQLLLPEYRKFVNDIFVSIGSISKIIYEDTTAMSQFLQASRNVVYSGAIMFGAEPGSAELLSYEQSFPWVTKINQRFERYVHNPELIMDDLRNEVITPALQIISDDNLARLSRFDQGFLKIATLTDNFLSFSTAVQLWIDEQPEYLAKYIKDNTDDIFLWIEDTLDYFGRNVLDPLGEALDIIKESVAINKANMLALVEKFPGLKELIYEFYTLDDADKNDAVALLRSLINQDVVLARATLNQALSSNYNDYKAGLWERYSKPFTPSEPDEKLSVPSGQAILPATPKGSWFVGEY